MQTNQKTRKKSKKVKKGGGRPEFPPPGNRDDLFKISSEAVGVLGPPSKGYMHLEAQKN